MDTVREKKKTSINLFANMISFGVQLIISFFITPFLIATVGKELYSFYPIATTIVNYMTIITTALNTMASRFITIELTKNNNHGAQKYFSSLLSLNFIIAGVMMIPSILIIFFIDKIFNIPIDAMGSLQILFSLVFASTIVNVISNNLGIATFAKNRIDLRSLREIIAQVAKLLLYVLFYLCLDSSIIYIGIISFVIAIINLVIQFFYTKKLLPEMKLSFRYTNKTDIKTLGISSLWNIISSLGAMLISGMSLILSNLLFSESGSGDYSIAQNVPNLLNSAISMLVGVFFPLLIYKYSSKNKNSFLTEILYDQKIIGSIGLAITFVFGAFSEEFFKLWTPSEDATYLFLLSQFILIQYIFISSFWVLFNVSVVLNKVKTPALVELLFGILNIICSIFFAKVLNQDLLVLPIISSLFTSLWIGVFFPVYISRLLKIKYRTFYINFLKILIPDLLIYTIVLLTKHSFKIDNWLEFILIGGGVGLFTLGINFFVVFGPKKVNDYVKAVFRKIKEKKGKFFMFKRLKYLKKLYKTFGLNYSFLYLTSRIFKFVKPYYRNAGLKILEREFKPILIKNSALKNSKIIDETQKNIFVFWAQGKDNMNPVAKEAFKRLKHFFNDYNIYFIDSNNYSQFVRIDEKIVNLYNNKKISIQSFSDVLRVHLINKYGGYWCDLTLLFFSKLDLFEKINEFDFYSLNNNTKEKRKIWGKVYDVKYTTYFFGSKKNNAVLTTLIKLFNAYYDKFNFSMDYFLNDYLFILCSKYAIGENCLETIPFDDYKPYVLQNLLLGNSKNVSKFDLIKSPQKINWRNFDLEKFDNIIDEYELKCD